MKYFIGFLLLLYLTDFAFAGTYTVGTSTATVDGDIFCDGTCDGEDEIILTPGNRGNLTIRDLKGSDGNHVTVKNGDSGDGLVNISATGNAFGIYIRNCEYVTVTGSGKAGLTYGIKSSNASTIGIYATDKTDEIILEYLEVTATGIGISSKTLVDINGTDVERANWTQYDTTVQYCYVHDVTGEGIYLGDSHYYENNEPVLNGVYVNNNTVNNAAFDGIQIGSAIANVSCHDNTITNIGASDLSFPGANTKTGLVINHGSVGEYYNNTIWHTEACGILCQGLAGVLIHDNILCGLGSYGTYDGMIFYTSSGQSVYDNIIIQANGYGLKSASVTVTCSRNLIGDCGSGESTGAGISESADPDDNVYYADVAHFGFQAWSDDGDYSNDDFSIRAEMGGTVFTQTSGNVTEAGIVTGGATIILNLDGTTWSAFDNTIRAAIVAGMDSEKSEATGWDALIKADPGSWSATGVVRTSDTVCTITLPASATYDITENETITITVPASAVTSAEAIQAGPDVLISADIPVASGTGYIGSYHANGCVATSLAQNFITDGTFDKTTVGSDLFDAETLGPELVTNGDFSAWTGDNPNGWTVSGESGSDPMITEVSGACRIYTTGTLVYLKTEGILEIGKTYKITFDIVSSVSSYLKIGNDSSVMNITSNVSSVGSKTYYHRVVNELAEEYIVIARGIGLTDITIDNFSVKEVTANARGQFSAPTAGSSDEIDDVTDRDFSDGNVGNWVAYEDGASTLTYDTTDLDFVDDKQIWLDVEDDGDETTYAYASIPSTAASVAASGLYEFRCKARSTVTTTVGGSDADMDTIWSGTQSLTANTPTRVTLYFYVGADAVGNILFGFSGDPSDEDGLRMDDFSIKKVNLSWVPYSTNKISVVDDSGNWALKTEYVDNSSGAYLSLRNIKDLTSDLTPGSQYKVILNTKVDTGDTVKGRIFDTSGDSYSGYFTTNYADYNIYYNCGSIESGSSLFSDMGTGDVVYINTITVQPVTLTHWVAGAGWGAYATAGAQVAKAYCYNATGQLQHTWTPTPGYTYMVRYTIADYSGTDAIVASLGGVNLTPRSANGTYEENVTALDATPLAFTGDIDVICTIDDVGAWRIGGS